MKLKNYLKYSGVWVSFAVNPYHWRVAFDIQKPNEMDPALYGVSFTFGPISVKAVLDHGKKI